MFYMFYMLHEVSFMDGDWFPLWLCILSDFVITILGFILFTLFSNAMEKLDNKFSKKGVRKPIENDTMENDQ